MPHRLRRGSVSAQPVSQQLQWARHVRVNGDSGSHCGHAAAGKHIRLRHRRSTLHATYFVGPFSRLSFQLLKTRCDCRCARSSADGRSLVALRSRVGPWRAGCCLGCRRHARVLLFLLLAGWPRRRRSPDPGILRSGLRAACVAVRFPVWRNRTICSPRLLWLSAVIVGVAMLKQLNTWAEKQVLLPLWVLVQVLRGVNPER